MVKTKLKETKLIDEILFSIEDVKGVDINIMDIQLFIISLEKKFLVQ